jgi:hypothetical protein
MRTQEEQRLIVEAMRLLGQVKSKRKAEQSRRNGRRPKRRKTANVPQADSVEQNFNAQNINVL